MSINYIFSESSRNAFLGITSFDNKLKKQENKQTNKKTKQNKTMFSKISANHFTN